MTKYKLTLLQFFASRFLIYNYNNKQDGVIIAVCGAGKTELCFPLFERLLTTDQIAFATPRIDICNEMYNRFTEQFPAQVGIHTGQQKIGTDCNLLILTTNQLLKYKNHFNLIVIDEVDAFPFDQQAIYYDGVKQSLRDGALFYLTSTPSARLTSNKLPTFTIYKRWHNNPLPVPQLLHAQDYRTLPGKLIKIIEHRPRSLLIFVATIRAGNELSTIFYTNRISHLFTYSTNPQRNNYLSKFKTGQVKILITTTILERGVNFTDVDVLVIDSDNSFYNQAALVQISGRACRYPTYQNGQVYFSYQVYTPTIKQAIKFIKDNNQRI